MAQTQLPTTMEPLPGKAYPRWFSPLRLLMMFCFVNLFVYLDRGLISSNGVNGSPRTEASPDGSGIQGDFDLTYFQDGLLPAAFMIGLLLSAPIFAEVCKQYSAFRLLGIGMGVWALACYCCGLAPNFAILMICRMFVGVGEASFVALAAPFIDDFAPPSLKARWFALFYLCIPVGFALGYIVGGIVASAMSWRWAFALEATAVVPFILFALTAQPLHLRGTEASKAGTATQVLKSDGSSSVEDGALISEQGSSSSEIHSRTGGWVSRWLSHVHTFWADVKLVASRPVWVLACIGYTLYVAVLGVYAYWGPKAGRALFFGDGDGQGEQADLVFGGVTVITGVLGSIAGGVMLDKVGTTLRNANIICGLSSLLGLVALLPTFLAAKTFPQFMAAFGIGQCIIFIIQAPVVAVQMWCVPPALRALGASLMTVAIHLLGDVPSPPLLGALQSHLSEGKDPQEAAQQWRVSMSLISLLLLFSGIFFLIAARISSPAHDFRQAAAASGQQQHGDEAPLLAGEESPDVSDGAGSERQGA